MYLSSVYGVVVSSDIELHMPAPPADVHPVLTLCQAPDPYDPTWKPDAEDLVSRWWDEARGHGYLAARTADGYRLRFHDLCDFDLTADLGHGRWRLAPGVDPTWIPVFATGTFMTLRHLLRGELVLHSSVVSVGGRGLAFVGQSGQGKSTMATLTCLAGARLVTDDVGRVRFEAEQAWVAAGGHESRLRESAAALADQMATTGAAYRTTGDGRRAVSLPTSDAVALDAIVIPMLRRDSTELTLHPVRPAQAVTALASFPRMLGLLDRDLLDREFHQLVDLVERVPVHLALIPWSSPPDPAIGPRLLDELGWR